MEHEILLAKLMITWSMNYLCLIYTQVIRAHKIPPLGSIISQLNPVHIPISYVRYKRGSPQAWLIRPGANNPS
jgi:hypothetical protein